MSHRYDRLPAILCIFSIVLVGLASPARATPWRDKVDPWVLQTASQGATEFLVSLSSQANLGPAKNLPTKSQKGWYVYQTLTTLAKRTQASLIAELERLGVEYHPFWVTNVIWVHADLNTLQLLAGRLDVAHIYANPAVKLDAPTSNSVSGASPQGIEWNISKVRAPEVWALGYTGQGTVIGGADTGYDWDHPAIKNRYRGWNGGSVDHDYSWFDATSSPSPIPVDPYGHGTHTMGTMVGDDGLTNKIGMAPGARWIGCRNMNADGYGTPETYLACYQWFIAPTRDDGSAPNPDLAPDVINNSWYCSPSEGCTDPDVLLEAVQNLVAAGIVSVNSAGNFGSACSSVAAPAAIYDESFSVGATDSSDTIASFSSRGPVTVDGSNRLKPDISAPGVDVRSSVPGVGYASLSGTSMASPHVAGLVALLISAQPALRGRVSQIEWIVEQNAMHVSSTSCSSNGVPNNIYGWGRIDALAAVQGIHLLQLDKSVSSTSVAPGDVITYTLTVTHIAEVNPTTNVVLSDTIPAGTSFVYATPPYTRSGNTMVWGIPSLDAMQSHRVDLAVKVNLTATSVIFNDNYAVWSDQVVTLRGSPVISTLRRIYLLPLVDNHP